MKACCSFMTIFKDEPDQDKPRLNFSTSIQLYISQFKKNQLSETDNAI